MRKVFSRTSDMYSKVPPQEPDDFLAIPKTLGRFLSAPYSKLSTSKPYKKLVTLKTLGRFLAPLKSSGSWGGGTYCTKFTF